MSEIFLIFLADSFCKQMFRLTIIGLLIALTGILSVSDYKVTGQQIGTQSCPTCKPPTQQVIYTPLIQIKESSYTEINLNCRSPRPIDAIPTFYTVEGMAIVGEKINLLPAEIRFVDVQSLIPQEERGKHEWGGMSLSYTGKSMEVWAQLTFHGVGRKESVNSLFAVIDAPRSNVREAVWRMPKNATATIAVGNYSDTPASASLTFSNGDVEQINIAPYGSKAVQRKNTGQNGKGVEAESVTINSSGQLGRMLTTGLIVSSDGNFASSIRFNDSQNTAQPNLYSTNFRLKNSTPHIVLKNTTTNPITAKPRFLPATGEGGAVVELPPVAIPANGIREVNLTALVSAAKNRQDLDSTAIQIINSGDAGSLIGAANTTNNLTGVDYDIPLRDSGLARNSTGGYPVRLDGDYTTILSITNVSDKTSKFTMQINYGGEPYAFYPQDIAPGATSVFDIRRMRDEQASDSSGRKLPRDLTVAQIRWSLIGDDSTRLIGRSEIVSASGKVSSSYSCNTCCPNSPQYAWMNPGIYYGTTGDTNQYIAMQQDADCYNTPMNPYPVYAYTQWTSSDINVATLGYNGLATAVDVGSAGITASWEATRWQEELTGISCEPIPMNMEATGDMVVRPRITSISPDRSVVNRTVDVTINGKGFAAGATVQVSGSGVTVPANNVVVVSATKITAKFVVAATAAQGNRKVTVTVNNQPSGQEDFLVQVPSRLEVFADTGNVVIQNCAGTVKRDVVYKIIDQDNKEIRQAIDIIEDLSNVSANSCGNGVPRTPSCTATEPPPQGTQAYLFADSISVNYYCNDPLTVQACQSNASCGYSYTQKWKTCGNDGNIQLYNVSGSTFCNQIKLNGSTQFSIGTRPPN